MNKSALRLVVALDGMLPVVCLAAGGKDVKGKGRGEKGMVVEEVELGIFCLPGWCATYIRYCMRDGRRGLHA